MLDRSIQPPIYTVDHIVFPDYQLYTLKNGIEIYAIPYGKQQVIKLEILLNAGSKFDLQPGISFFTARMLSEGTPSRSAKEIAEETDALGASLETSSNLETASISLYCLSKHIRQLLPLVHDIWQNSHFSEVELEQIKKLTIQNLELQQEKSAYLATKAYKKQIFGEGHPIASAIEIEDIEQINRENIVRFYQQYISKAPAKIFISGQVDAATIDLISSTFETFETTEPHRLDIAQPAFSACRTVITKKDAKQSSIRVGRTLFSRKHPDFFKFLVANEILGGYFGSRLMKNIREDKGYTYGINATFMPVNQVGYWTIGSDVKIEHTADTLAEIKKEIDHLKSVPVSESELTLVKNFMVGTAAAALNTPFEIADRLRMLIYNDMPLDFFSKYPENIRNVSASDVQYIANTYFTDLHEVVVGGI